MVFVNVQILVVGEDVERGERPHAELGRVPLVLYDLSVTQVIPATADKQCDANHFYCYSIY